MTTSYPLSLRLKELGVPQEGGEYYWAESWNRSVAIFHKSQIQANTLRVILCRALTLGEVVRELGEFTLERDISGYYASNKELRYVSTSTPEEAAGELLAETLKQKQG